MRIESRKPTFTGQPFNWHQAVHGSKSVVRRPHEEAKVSAKAGALFTKTPKKTGFSEEKGEPGSCPPRIENARIQVSEVRRPGTA